TVVERYANLLESGYVPSEIMMTTFTNKAAKDMIKKIRKRTDKISPFIGTMHSLFLKILRDNKEFIFEGNEPTLITTNSEQKKILREVLNEMDIKPDAHSLRYFGGWISKFKNRCILADDLNWEGDLDELRESGQITELMEDEFIIVDKSWRQKVNRSYKLYQQKLKLNNLMDFDEVLLLTYRLFLDNEMIRNEYKNNFKAIMVDEAQDLNIVQIRILELLQDNNLCLIGDDCQNIYEWRGASNDLVFKFRESENEIFLKENYRSTNKIIMSVNNVIDSMKHKIKKELILTRGDGHDISIDTCSNVFEEVFTIAEKIEQKINDGESLDDIAVLFRTNRLGKMIEIELLKRKIPCHLSKSVDFFSREEIMDLVSFLKLKVNPNSTLDFERIVLLVKGLGKMKVAKFREIAEVKGISIVESLEFAEELGLPGEIVSELELLHRALKDEDNNPIELFLRDFGYSEYLENKYMTEVSRYQDKMENLEVLSNLFLVSSGGVTEFLDSIIEIDKREQVEGKIILSTIHGAKGLEWKNVFLLACNEKTLPFYKGELSNMKRDSELRLFYVAISRAKDHLHITCSKDFRFSAPSQFLELIEKEDVGDFISAEFL
ncbi:ATP-dependent helicase, partial [Candidatus Pacearchaeota archaeon]|nr:ATP-dependent helicase [Candidatus Pacearchaeota archaeon]